MLLEINWCEKKKSAKGNEYIKATTVDGKDVTFFSTFPDFANIRPGAKIEAELKENLYNGKMTYSAESPKPVGGAGSPKTASIASAMKQKDKSIKEAQENRSEAVRIASTFRDATLITVAQVGTGAIDEIYQKEWLKWRSWLWQNWDVDETNTPPF